MYKVMMVKCQDFQLYCVQNTAFIGTEYKLNAYMYKL
jgi:spore coat protein CotF